MLSGYVIIIIIFKILVQLGNIIFYRLILMLLFRLPMQLSSEDLHGGLWMPLEEVV